MAEGHPPPPVDRRTAKWRAMLGDSRSDWAARLRSDPCAVRRRLWRGVPESLRGTVWAQLLGAREHAARHPAAYDKLCLYDDASDDDADRSKRKNVDEIVRDLPRTFPKHVFFHRRNGPGQRALFNVLKAVASFDPAVGYVQGMGFLAGTLLLHMPEEDAFWSLVSLLHASAHPSEPAMARLFAEGMPLLRRRCFELDRLLAIAAPRLKAHFAAEGVHPTMFASSWFTTLVSCGAPPEAAARVWDVALAEGPGVTCHRVAIALLLADADALLELPFDALVPRTRALPEKIDELFGGDLDAFLRAVGHAAEAVTHQALERIAEEWREAERGAVLAGAKSAP